MSQTRIFYEGKNPVCVLVNLILSLICFAGCIVAIEIASSEEAGLITLLVFDMISLAAATTVLCFSGKTSMFIYLGGVFMSFIAFCT